MVAETCLLAAQNNLYIRSDFCFYHHVSNQREQNQATIVSKIQNFVVEHVIGTVWHTQCVCSPSVTSKYLQDSNERTHKEDKKTI